MVLLPSGPGALFFLSFLGFFLSLVNAGIVNRTIDDSFGDSQTGQLVTYVPSSGAWNDENCVGCAINPDVTQTFKGTYTAATYNPGMGRMSITMQFTGIAIYVFFILANNAGDGITSLTFANFTLDGNAPQVFQHAPDLTTTAIDFNQLVFSRTNLINADHTLVISTSGVNTNVYVNFDYAIYTHDDNAAVLPLTPSSGNSSPSSSSPSSPSSSSSSSSSSSPSSSTSAARSSTATSASSKSSTTDPATGISASLSTDPNSPSSTSALGQVSPTSNHGSTPIGAIAGGVVGGLAVLILLALCLLWRIRKRKASLKDTRSFENGVSPVPPLMTEYRPPTGKGLPANPETVDPFITTNHSYSTFGNKSQSYTRGISQNAASSPIPDSIDNSYAYDGIADSTSSRSDGRRRAGGSTTSSSVLAYYGNSSRGALRSVTSGDHLSSPNTDMTTPIPTPSTRQGGGYSENVEDVRRARQNELNQRLRTVQEEMAFLASDMTGTKTRPQSVRRRRTITRPEAPGTGGGETLEVEDSEMSMAEMREQLHILRDQVSYLREQQRSDWAQGLSDDPPPGYTPASPTPTVHRLPPIPGQ